MVRRFSSLFFRQNGQDRVPQAAVDNVQAATSHPGVTPNPIQRTDFSKKAIRHVKSSGALMGTLRSLQYNTRSQTPQPPQPPQPPLPAQYARGLGELQEYFWLEDSLHRTNSQLDRCSNQLDQIHGSAAEVRRELEGLQVELGILQKKMQNGVDHVKSEESRKESPKPVEAAPKLPAVVKTSSVQPKDVDHSKSEKPRTEAPKPVEPVPKRPAIAKPSSIQQRIQFFSKIANT